MFVCVSFVLGLVSAILIFTLELSLYHFGRYGMRKVC